MPYFRHNSASCSPIALISSKVTRVAPSARLYTSLRRSCVTLFMHAAPGEPVFRQILEQYHGGVPAATAEQRI
jgi:hypothetical protein